MTAAAIAFASALVFGCADFLGGLAAKRLAVAVVVLLAHGVGLVIALALAVLVFDGSADAGDAAWGLAAGLSASAGVALLYYGLAHGVMTIVAPMTAATSAGLPVLAGTLAGETIGVLGAAGIAAALLGIVLSSLTPEGHDAAIAAGGGPRNDRVTVMRSIGIALLAGTGFGAFFILLANTGEGAGMWPLVYVRVASVTLMLVLALATRAVLRADSRAVTIAVSSGLLDLTANALYVVAIRDGDLAIIGLLASLYPVTTVGLAWLVLRERVRPVQAAGVALMLVGVIVLASR